MTVTFRSTNLVTTGHYGFFKLDVLYSMLKSVFLPLLFVEIFAVNLWWMVVPRWIIHKVRLLPAKILIFCFDKSIVIPSIQGDLLKEDAVITIIILFMQTCRI